MQKFELASFLFVSNCVSQDSQIGDELSQRIYTESCKNIIHLILLRNDKNNLITL